jgi:hypothetical protein
VELILKPTRQKGTRLGNWLTREQAKRSAGRPGPLDAEGKLVSRPRELRPLAPAQPLSYPGPKLMHGKSIVSSYIPDELQQERRPGFMCNSPGFQCSDNAVKSRKTIENKQA